MGKGKDSSTEAAREHVATPITSLKDPASFGPPPKHANSQGGAAVPNRTTPARGGVGATQEAEERAQQEEFSKPKPPPTPWRTDTTGLRTDHLPPPPSRVDGADGRTPVSAAGPSTKPKPSLPPRLPPRQNSNPSLYTPDPPPTYGAATAEPPAHKGYLNQGSLNRLGAAGISVPGFGIGKQNSGPPPPPSRTSSASTTRSTATSPAPPPRTSAVSPPPITPQLSELQSRFSRLNSSSPKPDTPSQGTSFAQKQAAIRTAQSFRNDPSSVSLSDARTAASTANNFRERHGEQVAAGWKAGNSLNQKYGIADKVGAYANGGPPPLPNKSGTPAETKIEMVDNTSTAAAKKKPAPPPPRKKIGLGGDGMPSVSNVPNIPTAGEGTPPPLPLASKPKYGVSG
jgi:hypothetical protein